VRSVGLDLGARHIAFCEVVAGEVTRKGSVRRLSELKELLGPDTPPARVAFEACREGWHVHERLQQWGKEPFMLDTTRIKKIGVGEHGRKTDAMDARAIALALDAGRVPIAHVLSPARRELRGKLAIRGELVEMRARQVTIIRGLARAKGILLPTCATTNFLDHLEKASLDVETRELIAPLTKTLQIAEEQLAIVDAELAAVARDDTEIKRCATAPGVGIIVAATFVSVIDDAKRFRNAHAVSAYLGLVPSERTTGGPGKRRLGAITKQGNTHARRMLVQAAWHILRTAPQDDPLRLWASRLAMKRGPKIAAVALARRLAGVLWAILRDGTFYDPGFVASKSALGLKTDAAKKKLAADVMARVAKKIQRRERNAAATSTPAEAAM
jgi:transposase